MTRVRVLSPVGETQRDDVTLPVLPESLGEAAEEAVHQPLVDLSVAGQEEADGVHRSWPLRRPLTG